MKAPDKIYVFQHGFNAFDPFWHFTESKEKYTESHEYIRKDAILEWLEERINDGDEEGLMTNQIANLAYKDVIDKLKQAIKKVTSSKEEARKFLLSAGIMTKKGNLHPRYR